MTVFTKPAAEVFAPTEADGSPRGPILGDAVIWGTEIEDVIDTIVGGVAWKTAVDLATTANITLSGERTIDGTLTSASRVLVKNQTTGAQNGIYVTGAGAWTRATDADSESELYRAGYYVKSGTANGGKQFAITTDTPITVGTTALTFVQIGDSGDMSLTKDDVGLDQVDNTSDADKPVSDATQAALDLVGISAISSVGGTATAYTGTADKDPAEGYWYWFTPNATNTASAPTLALNGGIARAIATRTGTLPAGALVSGVPVLLRYSSGNIFRLWEPLDSPVVMLTSVAGTSTAYTATLSSLPVISNSLLVLFVPHVDNGANATLSINGGTASLLLTESGTAVPVGRLKKNARYLGWYLSAGIFIIGLTAEVPADERVIEASERLRAESAREFSLAVGGAEDTPIFVASAALPHWIATSGDNHRLIYVAGERTIDLQLMPLRSGVPTMIYVAEGSGNLAKLFLGAGRKTLTAAPGSLVQVFRPGDDTFVVTALTGAVTEEADVSDPAPARDLTIITGGQSLARGWMLAAGFHGLQLGLSDLGWTPTIWPVQGATGGSGITSSSNATNYWWNEVDGLPGPAADTWKAALDAIPAEQPAPSAIYWCFGQTDASAIGTEFTIDEYAGYLRALFAWMRTQAGDANLPIIISPVGSQEAPVPTDAQFAAIRWVEMALIAEDANIHLGPSIYDLPRRFYDAHPNHQGQKLQGYRLAKTLNNLFNSGTDVLGPWVSKVEELDSGGRYRLTIEASQSNNPFTHYTENNGFAVLPSGADPLSGTPVRISSQYWQLTGGKWLLNLVLTSPSAGATIVYPWGNMEEVNTGRYIRDVVYWKVAGSGIQNHQPLRDFIGSAGEPPVAPTIP